MRILVAIIIAVASTACAPEQEEAAPAAPVVNPAAVEAQRISMAAEQRNLLNMGSGAAVVSRTAELTFENSAIRAIDGDPDSLWASPPLDFEQTLVFSLPAPVRIEEIGIRTPLSAAARTEALTIDWSADGETFNPLLSPTLQPSMKPQIFKASADNVRYIRLHVTDGGAQIAALQSVLIHGTWLAPPSVPPLAGCFTINETAARFHESNGRVSGFVGDDESQFVDGGVDDATYRFAWTRGPEWGYALVTLTPDGQTLNGLTWHEEAAAHSFGTSWYGSRQSCGGSGQRVDADAVVRTFLRRSGWYPLFSLHFDESGGLIEARSGGGLDVIRMVQQRAQGHRIRIIAREYRASSADEARKRAIARLESIHNALTRHGVDVSRIDFVAAGSDSPRRPVDIEVMRRFYGVVEIEVPETARSAF